MIDNRITKREDAVNILRMSNAYLLSIHIILLVLFWGLDVYLMVYTNLISIVLYLLSFQLITKERYLLFLRCSFFEIWIHMILATISVGWTSGFPLYSFGLLPVFYFANYVETEIHEDSKKNAIVAVIITAVIYFSLRVYTFYKLPIYILNNELISLVYLINLVITFSFACIYLEAFIKAALQSEMTLRYLADYDELTSLYKRYRIREKLEQVTELDDKISIAILDVDNFKYINDTYGHTVGDYVLKRIAMEMRHCSNEQTYLGRWGGEEFVIVQQYCNSFEECIKWNDELRDRISKINFKSEETVFHVTVTIGMVPYRTGMSIEEVVNQADQYLYIGKRETKNCVVSSRELY